MHIFSIHIDTILSAQRIEWVRENGPNGTLDIFIYINKHTHTHIYTYPHLYIYTHTYIYIYIYKHTYTHTYMSISIHLHIIPSAQRIVSVRGIGQSGTLALHKYAHTHTHIYICIYTHTHIYIYIYIYVCTERPANSVSARKRAEWHAGPRGEQWNRSCATAAWSDSWTALHRAS